jgi:23S rRNA pseudouridine2605 synthase
VEHSAEGKKLRIGKLLARVGLCPRRATAAFLAEHDVRVNGERVTQLNTYINADDIAKCVLLVDGTRYTLEISSEVLLLNKPKGVVCSHRRQTIRGKLLQTIFDLVPQEYANWFFAGRLDVNSEGLVVLSNDGDHIYALTHPSCGVLKKYYVRTSRPLSEQERKRSITGIIDKQEKLRFVQIEQLPLPAEYHIWLREGRNREIRRLLERLGVQVRRLIRLELGPYALGDLPPGKWKLHKKHLVQRQRVSHLTHTAGNEKNS